MSVWTPNMHLSIEGDQVLIPHSTAALLRVEVLQRSRSPEASNVSESCLALLGKLSLDNSNQKKIKCFRNRRSSYPAFQKVNIKMWPQNQINFFCEQP